MAERRGGRGVRALVELFGRLAARRDRCLGPGIVLLPGVRQPVDDDELTHRRVARDQGRLQRDELRGMRQRRQPCRRRHGGRSPAQVHGQLTRRQAPDLEEVRERLVQRLEADPEAVGVGREDPVPFLRQLGEVRLDVRLDLGPQFFRDEEAEVFGIQAVDRRDAGRGVRVDCDQQGLRGGFRRHAPDYSIPSFNPARHAPPVGAQFIAPSCGRDESRPYIRPCARSPPPLRLRRHSRHPQVSKSATRQQCI